MSSESSPLRDPEGLVGQVLAERYLLQERLGEGGMGSVYRATHVKMGRSFAIKILHAELLRNEKVVWRFEREAEAAARMRHPNVVPALDVGTTEEGLRYLVMDFVDGPDLATVMLEAPMPPPRVISLVRQICEGLQHAHGHGLIHRDLKPQNIIVEVDAEGREVPRIVDFGISILASEEEDESSRLTTSGMVLGTPLYMAPEQAVAGEIDHRVDLFALGLIVYEMVSGALPFDGTGAQVARANLMLDPPPMSRRVPDLSVDPLLEAFTRRLMQRDRDRRPGSAREARELLDLIERDRTAAAAALRVASDLAPSQLLTVPRLPSVAPSDRRIDSRAQGAEDAAYLASQVPPPVVTVQEEGSEVAVSLAPLGESDRFPLPEQPVSQSPAVPLTAPVQAALPLPFFPGNPPPLVAQPWRRQQPDPDRRAERYLTTELGYRHASAQRRRWMVAGVIGLAVLSAGLAVIIVSSGPSPAARGDGELAAADPSAKQPATTAGEATDRPATAQPTKPVNGAGSADPAAAGSADLAAAGSASTDPVPSASESATDPVDTTGIPPDGKGTDTLTSGNPARGKTGSARPRPAQPVTRPDLETRRPDVEVKPGRPPAETPKAPETPKISATPPEPAPAAGMTLSSKYKAVGALLNQLSKADGESLWARYSRINKNEAAGDPVLRQKAMEQLSQIEREARALLKP